MYLPFEKDIADVLEKMKNLSTTSPEYIKLEKLKNEKLKKIYDNLTPWDRVLISRHAERPHAIDYIYEMFDDFVELAGDRLFGEDQAIIGGIAKFEGISCVVIGQEKGHDIETRKKHNFGMAQPEGYRKAIRLMDLADRFGLPVITFVDTAGAYPGIEAEERGQAEAIARAIEKCLNIKVPFVSVVIGEGGSGGAIALAAANTLIMLENSVYSVISPEGCSSILWKDASFKEVAANNLKITAKDLQKMKVCDVIVKEPVGGAHNDRSETIKRVRKVLKEELDKLIKLKPEKIAEMKIEKYLKLTRDI